MRSLAEISDESAYEATNLAFTRIGRVAADVLIKAITTCGHIHKANVRGLQFQTETLLEFRVSNFLILQTVLPSLFRREWLPAGWRPRCRGPGGFRAVRLTPGV